MAAGDGDFGSERPFEPPPEAVAALAKFEAELAGCQFGARIFSTPGYRGDAEKIKLIELYHRAGLSFYLGIYDFEPTRSPTSSLNTLTGTVSRESYQPGTKPDADILATAQKVEDGAQRSLARMEASAREELDRFDSRLAWLGPASGLDNELAGEIQSPENWRLAPAGDDLSKARQSLVVLIETVEAVRTDLEGIEWPSTVLAEITDTRTSKGRTTRYNDAVSNVNANLKRIQDLVPRTSISGGRQQSGGEYPLAAWYLSVLTNLNSQDVIEPDTRKMLISFVGKAAGQLYGPLSQGAFGHPQKELLEQTINLHTALSDPTASNAQLRVIADGIVTETNNFFNGARAKQAATYVPGEGGIPVLYEIPRGLNL